MTVESGKCDLCCDPINKDNSILYILGDMQLDICYECRETILRRKKYADALR